MRCSVGNLYHGAAWAGESVGELRQLWIPGSGGRLEAALRLACPARAAAVVAHPHPLHGGTLHNPVVFHADRELHRAGLTTLRINFRGVGESEGRHDNGRGEVRDIEAAVSWLRGVAAGLPLLLVGYSFGFWCAIRHAVADHSVEGLVAIGLPTRTYAFDEVGRLACPLAVVQGSEDPLGGIGDVSRLLERCPAGADLHVVEGTGHRFQGRARDAAAQVVRAVNAMLGPA